MELNTNKPPKKLENRLHVQDHGSEKYDWKHDVDRMEARDKALSLARVEKFIAKTAINTYEDTLPLLEVGEPQKLLEETTDTLPDSEFIGKFHIPGETRFPVTDLSEGAVDITVHHESATEKIAA